MDATPGRSVCSPSGLAVLWSSHRSELRVMKDKYKEFYESYEWRKVRYDALVAADGKCQLCGRSKHDGIVLNVDHIVSLRKNWARRADIRNLQVLCRECNHGKGNRDSTDWRRETPVVRSVERKPKKKRNRKNKVERKRAARKEALARWQYGRMGAASEVRVVSIDEWIAEQVKKA